MTAQNKAEDQHGSEFLPHAHDVELQVWLKDSIQAAQPPEDATKRMVDAIRFLDESEVADLVMDSADLQLSIRGDGPRQLVFESEGVDFDVSIEVDQVRGQVVGNCDVKETEGSVTTANVKNDIDNSEIVMVAASLERHVSTLDDLGEFMFDVVPQGPFYLQVASGTRTGWILST